MLLTISTTHEPATDLGYLLHKNPDRVHEFSLSFGRALVFYPEASPARCTVALLLEIDPIELVRGKSGAGDQGFALSDYVNDRPYVASSFMAVALNAAFRSAIAGRSTHRQDLAEVDIPLVVEIAVLPSRGGDEFIRKLFEPLGYDVVTTHLPLDDRFPEWGESTYYRTVLRITAKLADVLRHLTVLIPVLDGWKHYWVGDDEVEKLLKRGEGWLASHPERDTIAFRYLKRRRNLMRMAVERLTEEETADPDEVESARDEEEAKLERPVSLHEQRLGAVAAVLKSAGAHRVVDLGCGEGKLIERLLKDAQFERIVGMDVSHRALERAADKLHFDRMPSKQRERVELIHGSLTYRDKRLSGYDAATLVEVIEHLDAARLATLERVIFEAAKPQTVVVTTPNVEYNVKFETLEPGTPRHKDHRFEWTRAEFERWGTDASTRFGYAFRAIPVGPEDPNVGAPTQMGVFTLSN
ncbi:MAG TPA: 3' terminal RNA ribose 2'-O-methyltransferase Hen1 [Candidatus Eremiobacteraceae bacterium]|jgi:3' terminal RNA ribose 2'-O-methyltransferase Hen1